MIKADHQTLWFVLIISIHILLAACKTPATYSTKALASTDIDLSADAWEPAGKILSDVFPGTRSDWVTNESVWTLPGMAAQRAVVTHRGKQLPNHQEFTVKSGDVAGPFRLAFEVRFEDEDLTQLPASWIGNTGIYIFGLYEVQIMRTSYFLDEADLPAPADGHIRVTRDSHQLDLPLNKFLCGALYGGGDDKLPLAGAPQNARGLYSNACYDNSRWQQFVVTFWPANFVGTVKKSCAVVSVTINDEQMLYGSHPFYVLPSATGSQRGKPEVAAGPLVIQDHGSRVSFRRFKLQTISGHPYPDEAEREAATCAL